MDLALQIENFISLAIQCHGQKRDVGGLLLLQHQYKQLQSIIDTLHSFIEELESLKDPVPRELAMRSSMTETLHFLLGLAADHANGEGDAETLEGITRDRGDIMTRFRDEIVEHDTSSNSNREALFVATGLFQRLVWQVREITAGQGRL